jgi:hypothetical protein
MSRSECIAQQLGMSHGAAAGKLRKNILFSLLVRLKENVCFKCSALILSANELSIEHKQPWEGISAELFWNLENIAFSHLRCNKPDRVPNRIRTIEGEGWCSHCKAFKSRNEFYPAPSSMNGLMNECKSCRSELKKSGTYSNRKSLT